MKPVRLKSEGKMPDLNISLAGVHAAVSALLVAADDAKARWTVPRAPGKWSPSQVVEHVARIMDESANVVSGVPSRFPNIPSFLRPIIRGLVFRRILKKKSFFKLKAIEAMDPTTGAATPAEARVRLAGTLTGFDQACRARSASGKKVVSSLFGAVSVADFAEFQELHVRHHLLQMPGAA
jgi:hypothetical protein